jgi:VanZ family protein
MRVDHPTVGTWLGRAAWITAFAIVYGSLVPFQYRPVSWQQAVESFAHLKWFDLGVEARADWVANLVLYLPFGFFACGALGRRSLALGIVLAALFGVSLAIGVEFAQIWAAPRTVSLNDVVAESAGTIIGVVIWTVAGPRLIRAVSTTLAGGRPAVAAALTLYLLAYAFLALFPFDFLVSREEIAARLADPNAIVWIPQHVLNPRGVAYLFLKAGLMMPLGAAARLVWHWGVGRVITIAVLLSGAIEIGHWFEFSAEMDAISVAGAVSGSAFGYAMAERLRGTVLRLTPRLRTSAWLAIPVYLAMLPVVKGWHFGLAGRDEIMLTLRSVRWLPFYYHYFTSEQAAVASLLKVAASYAPVGAFFWAARLRTTELASKSRSLGWSALTAAVLATGMEAGGLITSGLRPDPTNVLIAAAAAMLTQRICEWGARIGYETMGSERPAR